MHILVKGTTVLEWNEEEPYQADGDLVPFEVDDGGFLATVEPGHIPHWDGTDWWTEEQEPTPAELSDALAEVADLAASNEVTLSDMVDAIFELAELIGGGE